MVWRASAVERSKAGPARLAWLLIAMTACLVGPKAWAVSPRLRGVNLAGADFSEAVLPGVAGRDYAYPSAAEINLFLARGLGTFRLPFRWERLQPRLDAPFDAAELARLDAVVVHTTARGGHVILDPHNYARWFGHPIGSAEVPVRAFAALWRALAERYRGNPRVIFGLMNEPHDFAPDAWAAAAGAALRAIRKTGARNLVLVPGTAWSNGWNWLLPQEGKSNAAAFELVTDPGDNMAFEIHQYVDADNSGRANECVSENIGVDRLQGVTAWLRALGRKGFLGEFGAAGNTRCLEALDRMLTFVHQNADVWIGWTYWAAGARWHDYPYSAHPVPAGDPPQLQLLECWAKR